MFTFAPWQAATSCTGSARPGAKALMNWSLGQYPGLASNLGIYACRPVRGTTTTYSIHSEGRAVDVGFPVVGGVAHVKGTELLNRLGPHGATLGIQTIIWNRRIYSQRSPGGRAYTGVNPHLDHLHIELTRTAASSLTEERIRQVVGGTTVRRTLRLTSPLMSGIDVRDCQRAVGAVVDGFYGPQTVTVVKAWQGRVGLVADGVFGPKSWAAAGY